MNLDEVLGVKEFSVYLADSRLQSENCVICWDSKINDPGIKSLFLLNYWQLSLPIFLLFNLLLIFFGIFRLLFFFLIFLVEHLPTCIFNLEWQNISRLVDSPNLSDMNLHRFVCASLNLLPWFLWLSNNFDNRLSWNLAHVLCHVLADCLVIDEGAALNALGALSDVQEVGCSFAIGSVQSASNTHLFAFLLLSNFSKHCILFRESNFGIAVRLV